MNKPLVLVFGLNYTARLGMIRAVGMLGCDVVIVRTNNKIHLGDRVDAASKYVVEVRDCINQDENKLIEIIKEYKSDNRDVYLMPTDDYPASVIDKHFDELKSDFLMPNIQHSQGAVVQAMDKAYQKEIAQLCGFDVARAWTLTFEDGEYKIPADITYPCFAKPQESYSAFMKELMKKSDSEGELRAVLNAYVKKGYTLPILVEQFIDIEREYVIDGLSLAGKSYHEVMIQKGLIYRGVTATGTLIPTDSKEGLSDKIAAFFDKLQFTGIYDIELFESNGHIYFNELNARIGACGYAYIHTVANYPQYLLEYLKTRVIPRVDISDKYHNKTFASEKACMQLFMADALSRKQYIQTLNQSDFRFLKQKSDYKPFLNYIVYIFLASYIQKLVQVLKHAVKK